MRDLLNNRMGCRDKISSYYKANPVSGTWDTIFGDNSNDNNNNSAVNPNTVGETGIVMANTVNISEGARMDRLVVTKVSSGTKVTISSILGDWYKVKLSNGTVEWCVKTYTS